MTIVVFDLDDTLYEEKGPKVAAECRVAAGLSVRLGLPQAEALRAFLDAKRQLLDRRELGPARNERRRWIAEALSRHGVSDTGIVHFRRGAYANFNLGSLPGCEPTWTVDYLTDISPLLL